MHAIENMDETPIYLNMSTSTTLQAIGSKKANTKALKNIQKLTILTSREKLAPLLIFKAKEEKDTESFSKSNV